MTPTEPPRICTSCAKPHVDNCPDCFGFGLYNVPGGAVPVRAVEAINRSLRHPVVRCATCGGTENGVPHTEPFDIAGIHVGDIVTLPLPGIPSAAQAADGTLVPLPNADGRFRVVDVSALTLTVELE